MNKDAQSVSRRNFLTKSAVAAAATASILVIETSAATNTESFGKSIEGIPSSLFDCQQAQTLTNKIIPSIDNILGTDQVNVREFEICGTDITDALNDAIDSLKNIGAGNSVPRGGQILIPRGEWTTRGGHKFYPSISIEGVGTQMAVNFFGVAWATELHLVPDEKEEYSDYMFMIDTLQHNCTLKNLTIDLGASNAIGLLFTNEAVSSSHIKHTTVENVTFSGGDYGIKVDSTPHGVNNPSFECILNQFKRILFYGCQTSFFCNTVNSGFLFDTCHFALPEDGIALDLETVGNISIEHCLFVPSGATAPNSTILKTTGLFNSISFYDCQDEGIVYAFQNTHPNSYDYISVVYRNCLIQSRFKFNTHGSVVLDSCRVYSIDSIGGAFEDDSSNAAAKVYLKGQYNFFRWSPTIIYSGAPIASFSNLYSKLIFESLEIGLPEIVPASATVPSYYNINKTRGLINIDSGVNNVLVYNNLVTPDSIIFTQLHTADSGGARISNVACFTDYFYINLTANSSNKLRVAFKIEV